jgi:glycosyltransferase involved in cell wall biosynthesis
MTISMDQSERQPVPTPILFMSDDPAGRGGTETGLVQKASGLGPEWRPLVMVPSSGHLHGMLTQAGVDTRVLNLYRLPRFWRVRRFFPVDAWITILANTWRLRRLLRQERIALILTVAKQTFNVRNVTRAAHPVRIPVVWSCHDTNPKVLTYCRRGLCRKLDRIIVVSEYVKQELLRAGLDCPDKIEVVHNAIDLQNWDAQTAAIQTTLREELGVPGGRPVVGLVARLDRVKGQREFLLAADMVAQAHPDATFLLVGVIRPASRWAPFSEYYREVAALAGRPALRGRVLFVGWRTDLPRVMASLDILVQPSHRETFGRVLLEAMASRRPVIATRVGGMPEIVRHGETGLLVPPGDPQALAAATLTLLADPATRQAMGEAGRRRVEERFGLPEHLRRLEAIYADVLCWRYGERTVTKPQGFPDQTTTREPEDALHRAGAPGAPRAPKASEEAFQS